MTIDNQAKKHIIESARYDQAKKQAIDLVKHFRAIKSDPDFVSSNSPAAVEADNFFGAIKRLVEEAKLTFDSRFLFASFAAWSGWKGYECKEEFQSYQDISYETGKLARQLYAGQIALEKDPIHTPDLHLTSTRWSEEVKRRIKQKENINPVFCQSDADLDD